MINKYTILFTIGGVIYFLLEILWRGYSHWTMFILGGICFVALGLINEVLKWDTPLWLQMLIGGSFITAAEFVTGCIVNLWLGWNVWNYTSFDILGQISLGSSVLWYFLSAIGIILDDYLRYWFFAEEKPHYKLFSGVTWNQ